MRNRNKRKRYKRAARNSTSPANKRLRSLIHTTLKILAGATGGAAVTTQDRSVVVALGAMGVAAFVVIAFVVVLGLIAAIAVGK